MRFGDSPLLVIWETTQACDLACVHCRASAAPQRHSSELSTEEAYRLLDAIREFGNPLMVFAGGDPLKRPEISSLLRRSVELGLRTNISPSATPLLTRDKIWEFRKCGVARMAISLDGPDAETHDGFRGVPGTFNRAVEALEDARRIGLETQIQTALSRRNMHRLDEIAGLAARVGTRAWSVFFLVATGRALAADDLSAEEYEQVFEKLYNISRHAPFDVQTTEAMHYRRYLARRLHERAEPADQARTVWRTAGVSDGRGVVFISHSGEIFPSGFLRISAGNVRFDSLVNVYRNSPLFLELRDADARHGKCGVCEYRKLCGGSRARAYALAGDYLAEDPRCAYQPGSQTAGAHQEN
jgi:AdoMet-dependent heme synthase